MAEEAVFFDWARRDGAGGDDADLADFLAGMFDSDGEGDARLDGGAAAEQRP